MKSDVRLLVLKIKKRVPFNNLTPDSLAAADYWDSHPVMLDGDTAGFAAWARLVGEATGGWGVSIP